MAVEVESAIDGLDFEELARLHGIEDEAGDAFVFVICVRTVSLGLPLIGTKSANPSTLLMPPQLPLLSEKKSQRKEHHLKHVLIIV